MQAVRPQKVTFQKRSVSLRADQWAEIERVATEEARHGMVSRVLQDAVDAWRAARTGPTGSDRERKTREGMAA
jgi:hypothetical protein